VSLPQVLDELGRDLTGFCMTPAHFVFVRHHTGQLETPEQIDIAQTYEAHFFDGDIELRWLRDPEADGTGTAVCLSDSDPGLSDGWGDVSIDDVESLPDSHRLMTGTLTAGQDDQPGWRHMNAPRHGRVALPLTDARNGRPAYVVREYLGCAGGPAGEDGNRMIVEERIIRIDVIEE
jgi:hypothetical protein